MMHIEGHKGLEQLRQRLCRNRVGDWRRGAQETLNLVLILVVNVYTIPVVGTLRQRREKRTMYVQRVLADAREPNFPHCITEQSRVTPQPSPSPIRQHTRTHLTLGAHTHDTVTPRHVLVQPTQGAEAHSRGSSLGM